jgi:hypothetical protein
MKRNVSSLVAAVAFGGLIAFSVFANVACGDDNNGNINVTTGHGGNGGGAGGNGGAIIYTVTLTAHDEVPSNASTGTGSVMVTLHPATGAVEVTGTFRGLSSVPVGAHIHGPADPGQNAPIIVPLTPDPDTTGSVAGSGTLSTDMINDMESGKTYVNIHTTTFPDGEIRGQITR